MLNASYFLCILLYMSFLIRSNTYTLPMAILLTGAVILVEINIINVHMSPVSAVNEESTATLKEKFTNQYAIDDSATLSVTYDVLAIWGGCCGIVDQFDFQDMELKYLQKGNESKKLQVPPTCCTRAVFEKEPANVLDCATKAENIYSEGCYVVLYHWLRKYCNIYSLIIIIKLMDMCVHTILYKRQVHRWRLMHTKQMM
ncbi:unnamed protein product [Lymnaea stagnalis]|uniref:Uncharacterized protein n=1 Tax=Lymnaea stagnalis TaxID=6523 RepID=A0AAV2IBU7_LYMST